VSRSTFSTRAGDRASIVATRLIARAERGMIFMYEYEVEVIGDDDDDDDDDDDESRRRSYALYTTFITQSINF
jgi:hypothetical protein